MRGGPSNPAQEGAPSPASFGATKRYTSSHSRRSRKLPWMRAPPSTMTEVSPRPARRRSRSFKSTWPDRPARQRTISAPARSSAAMRAGGARKVQATSVGADERCRSRRAAGGRRAVESTTTRTGSRGATPAAARPGPLAMRGSRAVRRGSSASAVPTPISTASISSRSTCPSRRDSRPLTQRESPERVAILPSSVTAALSMTQGSFRVMNLNHISFAASQASRSTPTSTRRPAARRRRMPRPWTRGFGSTLPITTRRTPEASTASVHGGVRPWWSQGSSVTYRSAPRARSPASRSATTSACGPPAFAWWPRAITSPFDTTSAPTTGFGWVRPRPSSASATASSMSRSSRDGPLRAGELLLLALALVDQLLQLAHELAQVLERAVHGGEADVRHLVEPGKLAHHRLADEARGHFLFAELLEPTLDAVDDRLDLLGGDGPLLAGKLDAGDHFVAIEVLAAAVLLHHHREDLLHPFVGGEAPLAAQAFAPPPDHRALVGETRVDDLVLQLGAERAFHVMRSGRASSRRAGTGGRARAPRRARARAPRRPRARRGRGRSASPPCASRKAPCRASSAPGCPGAGRW